MRFVIILKPNTNRDFNPILISLALTLFGPVLLWTSELSPCNRP